MSVTSQDRRSRWQDIEEGLKFIQSTLPFHGTQEQYEEFIQALVRNLFAEGNDMFLEGEWMKSVELHTEALNIAEYAESEDICVSQEIKEKLHANRAASYLNIGLHDQALEDCEKALQLNEGNYRALYRKARCLKEMGKYQAAYDAVAKCSMAVPQDAHVIEMTQELAKMLGLKIRKPYVRSKPALNVLPGTSLSGAGNDKHSQSSASVEYIEMELGSSVQRLEGSVSAPVCSTVNENVEVESQPIVGVISQQIIPVESYNPEPVPLPMHMPLVNGTRHTDSYTAETRLDYDTDIMGDDLDELLDRASPPEPSLLANSDMSMSGIPPIGMGFSTSDGLYAQHYPPQLDLAKNPLADSHEFIQACTSCYIKTGPGVLDYSYLPEDHKCKKDLLLGRHVANGEECRYHGHCTFAYCQEEIDVWTLERKGFICRDNLSDPYGPRPKINLTVPKILQEHHGIFMFLCEVCFDHKPRIISKTNKDNPGLCSHPVTKHAFEEKKCLVHIMKDKTVKYTKIRPYHTAGQMDLCRHEVRYGCQREDFCFYAHSLIELKVWMMQSEQGISHENIVLESQKYCNMNAAPQESPATLRRFGPPNLKMQFVCGQCWRNGQVIEPDKNKKYCSAKARHPWSKERRVVLVSSVERKKWTTVRPLPTKKPVPLQFEICMHVAAGKKCQYIGNCTFAHSTEERDLWTFMKENNISDMEQLYEMWLQSQRPGWSEETFNSSLRENGRQIHMPTDYAEEVAGNHCWLCGKNCNSDKQWQQHITSEKHKARVFNSEDDQSCWQYRFPTGTFKVCERFLKGTCTEGEQCKLAHGEEELNEWRDRREFLLLKLAKARAKSDDPSSPDWVPSVFSQSPVTKKRKRKKDVDRSEQSKSEEEMKEQAAVDVLLKLSSATHTTYDQKCNSKMCKEKIARLQKDCNDLRKENRRLKDIIKTGTFNELALKKDDHEVKAMS
ncbi:Zinc finger CCCH domain-containing protein 7A [Triplophysa tibetana]|uniref:Zinc finger CCCH domain-containing protein 7A n=1 Tax=Triplophysa tibetana TaxID=1572043 RepID=A0A5A9N8Z4_9TELE|nr:Zinc finger CCCH domain-containing protein 7A [Triplophysa tibetana]